MCALNRANIPQTKRRCPQHHSRVLQGQHPPAQREEKASGGSSSKPASRLSELGTSPLERTTALKCRVKPPCQWAPCYANERVSSAPNRAQKDTLVTTVSSSCLGTRVCKVLTSVCASVCGSTGLLETEASGCWSSDRTRILNETLWGKSDVWLALADVDVLPRGPEERTASWAKIVLTLQDCQWGGISVRPW